MRKLYVLLLLVAVSSGIKAQAFLKFTTTSYNLDTVPYTGQSLNVTDTLYNTSGNTYTGSVYFYARVNGVNLQNIDSINTTFDTVGTTGSYKSVVIHIPYGNPAFINGPNGVVIWPLYSQPAGPFDSVRITVVKTFLTGIEEAPLAKVYIAQHGGDLNIEFADMGNLVKQVSLYDLTGKRLFTGSVEESRHIATSGWNAGVYFCEIATYKGEKRTIKFVLQ